ncbi:pyrroline-5-carboxylate reductase [Terrihabitans sp. B22-R8]|uniref:pyrroline-5-carboxylate reductase n=1 Tax=Terrihabitans sp. B22-R8 TaxID=3425128 RepID=UPI00403D26B5
MSEAGGNLHLPGPLLVIGAGKMAGALLEGWLRLGVDPTQVYAVDPSPADEVREALESAGVNLNASDVPQPAVVLLAVKPQMLEAVHATLSAHIGPGTLVVSVLAGKSLATLAQGLPAGTAIIRTMPNTPASVGRGITALVANAAVSADQRALGDALLQAVGEVVWLDDEGQIDAVTAISGCGPAYVFLLAECMAQAGVNAGLSEELAARLARATVTGAGELLHRSDLPPDVLRRNVTSPNGVTAEALAVLMGEGGFQPLLDEAVERAVVRSRELAG